MENVDIMSSYILLFISIGVFFLFCITVVNIYFCVFEQESIAGWIVDKMMNNARNIWGKFILSVLYIVLFPFAIIPSILGIIVGIICSGFDTLYNSFEILFSAIGITEYLELK